MLLFFRIINSLYQSPLSDLAVRNLGSDSSEWESSYDDHRTSELHFDGRYQYGSPLEYDVVSNRKNLILSESVDLF